MIVGSKRARAEGRRRVRRNASAVTYRNDKARFPSEVCVFFE
jgi:hypothetical protein